MVESNLDPIKLARFAKRNGIKSLKAGAIEIVISDQALQLWHASRLPEMKAEEFERKGDVEHEKLLFHSA